MRHPIVLAFILGLLNLSGCADESSTGDFREVATQTPLVEEPDIYHLEGSTLYVQNQHTGLNILDVSAPASPRLLGRAPTQGVGGEMFLRPGDQAVIMLKSASARCKTAGKVDASGWTMDAEVAFVDASNKSAPALLARHCLPGSLVSSRTVGNILYFVTTNGATSRAYSFDISDPASPLVVQRMDFAGATKEILVTPTQIFVASRLGDETDVEYVSIDAKGQMTARGHVYVPGEPQGRFHMDATSTQFRIVTYESQRASSRLTVIDISNPDKLAVLGDLGGIGGSERLFATRFDGNRAYVVTFRRTDPLWIISLDNPQVPQIVGELRVPGWSDFIFPRGDRLVAVGMGASGSRLGVSLFDVTDISHPLALHQIELGGWRSSSEASTDHRATTIVEIPGALPLILVPTTTTNWTTDDVDRRVCTIAHTLHLIDLDELSLNLRGSIPQFGAIRRSLVVGGQVLSISEYEIKSSDVSVRDRPQTSATLTLGTKDGLVAGDRATCDASDNFFID